jgi:hypothetical protein
MATPGFCLSTADGREYLKRVQEYSARRQRVEETYYNAVTSYENESLRVGRLGPEAHLAWAEGERSRVQLLANQYNSRNAQYEEAVRLLHSEFDGAVLAVHYEPIIGNVCWWRPLNRAHRVFHRLAPDEFERVREQTKERGR